MKKVLLTVAILFFLSGSLIHGQRVFEENFSYPVGSLLTANGYTVSSGGGTNALTVTSPGLTFPQYPAVTGNALTLTTTGEDDYKSFTSIAASGSVYLSFLINVQSAQTGDYFIAISPSTSQTNYYARVHVKSSGSGYLIGISKSNEVTGGASYGPTVFNFNSTYLVIVKHTFVPNDFNDVERIFVFSSAAPSTEPATSEVGPYTETTKSDPVDISFVTYRQGSSSAAAGLIIDGIRIATSWNLITDVKDNIKNIPNSFSLEQNYPNPFNPSTVISWQLAVGSHVSLKVYDLLGREVATLVNEFQVAGRYEKSFIDKSLPAGIYFYTLTSGNFTQTKKMTLIK
jgi:hypothetical protein